MTIASPHAGDDPGLTGTIRPVGDALGAEVIGIDLSRPLPEPARCRIEAAFLQHKVFEFRDQHLDKQQLVAFSRLWGPLGEHIMPGAAPQEFPAVAVASNADAEGKPNGRHTDETAKRWHTDRSYMPRPAVATLFYGIDGARTISACYECGVTMHPGD